MNDFHDAPDPFTDNDRWERPRDYQDIQSPPTKPIDEPLYPHRTLADRRRDVIRTLEAHPEYSDRRITRIAVVSRELVTGIRRNLIRKCRIASQHALRRVGADGKTYRKLPKPKSQAMKGCELQ
jgi:hypothetical protein